MHGTSCGPAAPPPRARATAALGLCLVLAAAGGCRRLPRRVPVPTVDAYDASPIDVGRFAAAPATQQRVLGMRLEEAGHRLGSLRLEADSTLTVTRGEQAYEQADHYALTQDSQGNTRLLLETPASAVELYGGADDVLVRYDRGSLRRKSRRDVDVGGLTDVACSALARAMHLLGPLRFEPNGSERLEGRPASRFTVRAATAADGAAAAGQAAAWHLPAQPPPRWQEAARVVDVRGSVSLDDATGAVLRAQLAGRLEVPLPRAAPLVVTLQLTQSTTEVGRVAALKLPRAVPEFRRPQRLHDPIAFFRDQVPLPSADAAAAPTPP